MTTATHTTLDVTFVPALRPYGYSRGRAIPSTRPAPGSAAERAHGTSGSNVVNRTLGQFKARLVEVLDNLRALVA